MHVVLVIAVCIYVCVFVWLGYGSSPDGGLLRSSSSLFNQPIVNPCGFDLLPEQGFNRLFIGTVANAARVSLL